MNVQRLLSGRSHIPRNCCGKGAPQNCEMMQLQFKESCSKDCWLKVGVSDSIMKKRNCARVCVRQTGSLSYINEVRITLSKFWGEWSQGPWCWAWTCLLSILYYFLLLLSLSPGPFCYVQIYRKKLNLILQNLVRFTCANKKGLLTCKLCLGMQPKCQSSE